MDLLKSLFSADAYAPPPPDDTVRAYWGDAAPAPGADAAPAPGAAAPAYADAPARADAAPGAGVGAAAPAYEDERPQPRRRDDADASEFRTDDLTPAELSRLGRAMATVSVSVKANRDRASRS